MKYINRPIFIIVYHVNYTSDGKEDGQYQRLKTFFLFL